MPCGSRLRISFGDCGTRLKVRNKSASLSICPQPDHIPWLRRPGTQLNGSASGSSDPPPATRHQTDSLFTTHSLSCQQLEHAEYVELPDVWAHDLVERSFSEGPDQIVTQLLTDDRDLGDGGQIVTAPEHDSGGCHAVPSAVWRR